HRQHQLVLGGGEAGGAGRLLGEALEHPQGVAEAGQGAVVGQRDRSGRHAGSWLSGCWLTGSWLSGSWLSGSRLSGSRPRWVSMNVIGRLSTRATSAAMSVTGSKGRPAISVTTSVVPSGVLVTPTHSATIMVAMS